MRKSRSHSWARIAVGVAAGLLLHGVAGWWSATALAQTTNSTITTSTSSGTSFESPPACSPVRSSRVVETVTLEGSVGPATIIIGNRDTGGTVFVVLAGWTNLNANTHTETFQCVAAGTAASVPALSWPALLGLAGILGALGAWQLSRR